LDREISSKIIKTAIPASLGQSFTAIGFAIMNGIIVSYGVQTVAAFSVGNRVSSLILHPVMAIGGVLSAYLGQNIGNQNIARARETFKKAMILSAGIMALGSLIFLFIREAAVSPFIKNDPVTLDLAVEYMFYLLIGLPLMGIFQTFVGTFNGTGNTKFTFIFTITRLWILRIPLVYFFKIFTDLGSSGIWYGMLISNILIIPVGIIMYKKVDFKPKVNVKQVEELELSVAEEINTIE
ncbi:MAG: MATE family efflux transporter, partial [Acholeplasmataceae bacterium]|nr:MATE family efflux transporter [Acholeplasmataceae bacterium]